MSPGEIMPLRASMGMVFSETGEAQNDNSDQIWLRIPV